ncbi:translin-associated factor [Niveomyces insectorum RCEF 264]|uniref:Translin-associated factor n=1 Tax=Niveomyces insectorum RCEF 264 TaxID=1081102 RepID=A0A167N0T5_9HYPO|nr:translin-associated factor [Niveomyces insectorum RCEF 264]
MAPEGKRRWQGEGDRSNRASSNKRPARPGASSSSSAAPRNAYTPMFEQFRDHLDAHHDRRERVVKASRDITALSKKAIFALQRVRRLHPDLAPEVDREVGARLADIGRLLAGLAPELQGINRSRYGRVLFGLEELVEALAFRYYLQHQALVSPEETAALIAQLCREGRAAAAAAAAAAATKEGENEAAADAEVDAGVEDAVPTIAPDEHDYLMGVLDLSGEMMRFATTSAALRGQLARGEHDDDDDDGGDDGGNRTVVNDMQALASFFQMLPQRHDKSWKSKMQVLQTSVQKVERLGYDFRVRGSERPKGWVPDNADDEQPGSP